MEQHKIDLKFPFEDLTGEKRNQVTIKGRVKVGDMMAVASQMELAKAPPSAENVYLIARMCGLDILEIERMDVEDFNTVVKRVLEGKTLAS
jgi:hypothetical protein